MKKDDHIQDATRYLCESLEKAMFAPQYTKQAWDLKELLSKLSIKSAKNNGLVYGGIVRAESLEATLRSITFEEDQIKFWKDKVK
jgi:hypothetical protein